MTVESTLRKPPTGIGRALFRAPVALYRCRLGWLVGERLILIEHRGRRTGLTRRTVVEVVERRIDDDSYVVAAGFGARSQWYRNLWANPRAVVQVGRRRLTVEAQTVSPAEGGDVMARYATRRPATARLLCRFMGLAPVGDDYRAAGERIPFLRLCAVEQPSSPAPDPAKATRTFRLPDGRSSAHTEWGDPQGFPTFYFHGTPGSRLEAAIADRAASRHGLRLIAPDRPGFGLSTFQPGRRFRDWPADVCAIADALGIDAFGVVGHSGGGPHAFACGAVLSPDRLRFVGVLGRWGPVASPRIRTHLARLDRFYAALARRSPLIMRAAFTPLAVCGRYAPALFVAALRASLSSTDRAVLDDDRISGHFKLSVREAFRQGGRGAAHEALIAYRGWDFDLTDAAVPTHVRRVAGRGHYDIAGWDEIFAACRESGGW